MHKPEATQLTTNVGEDNTRDKNGCRGHHPMQDAMLLLHMQPRWTNRGYTGHICLLLSLLQVFCVLCCAHQLSLVVDQGQASLLILLQQLLCGLGTAAGGGRDHITACTATAAGDTKRSTMHYNSNTQKTPCLVLATSIAGQPIQHGQLPKHPPVAQLRSRPPQHNSSIHA